MTTGIYLDYNATCPVRGDVIELVAAVMGEGGNPSSVHGRGRKARARVETARGQIAALIGCKAQEIIFTSGGTEANNMALNGFPGRLIFVSAAEHDSVLAPASSRNAPLVSLAPSGLVDLGDLDDKLKSCDEEAVVSIMLANNETGICQQIAPIAEMVHSYGGLLHVDAIQAVGKIAVDFRRTGADLMSISAHKIGGPQGQGALVIREGLAIRGWQSGGGQELGRRGGTENVAGIAGFGLAARMAADDLPCYAQLQQLRDSMEAQIKAYCPDVKIYGEDTPRLPNTSCLSMPGVRSELQVMNFDLAGIAVSAGSACSSGKVKASHVLTAMGADNAEAAEAIRVSLGRETTAAEMDKFVQVWKKLYEKKSPGKAA